jgi:hypothetical protein
MLVIANGCGKCGSTWLASTILELVEPRPLPATFQERGRGEMPTLPRGMLRRFLDEVDYERENYVTKSNFYYERRLLAKYKNIYVIDIERDPADVVISMFFHSSSRMNTATAEQVRHAYWGVGPVLVEHVVRHHAVWGPPCSWFYRTSYERLKATPEVEIAAFASFLGIAVSPARIQAIIDATTLHRLAEKWSTTPGMEKRFRKGVVGDHRNYFDGAIVSDIRRIESENRNYPRNALQKLEFALERRRFTDRSGWIPYERKLARHARALQMSW